MANGSLETEAFHERSHMSKTHEGVYLVHIQWLLPVCILRSLSIIMSKDRVAQG